MFLFVLKSVQFEGVSVKSLAKLRRALSIAQHHDAITGTAKQFVNDNYVKLLGTGIEETLTALETAFGTIFLLDKE